MANEIQKVVATRMDPLKALDARTIVSVQGRQDDPQWENFVRFAVAHWGYRETFGPFCVVRVDA